MLTLVTTPEGWNAEILHRGGCFLQSWQWGTFQERAGFKTMRLRCEDGSPSLWLERAMPFGKKYWYCPRGPLGIFKADDKMFDGAAFLRIEPPHPPMHAKPAHPVQPGQTIILDLSKSQDDLLKDMHAKTRYNINLAARKGVRVYQASGKDPNAFEIFWSLVQETTGRNDFSAHGKEYYRTMLDVLQGDAAIDGKERPVAKLVFAEFDGKVLAANLMIWFGDTMTYLHGASSSTNRDVMAPYALHWELIKQAKEYGYADYDLWGIAPEGVEKHQLAGVTRFKKNWGGTYVQYPGTFDIPLDKLVYLAYSLVRRMRP